MKLKIIFIILNFYIFSLKAQDSISFSNNNIDTFYSVIYNKVYELRKKCYDDYFDYSKPGLTIFAVVGV